MASALASIYDATITTTALDPAPTVASLVMKETAPHSAPPVSFSVTTTTASTVTTSVTATTTAGTEAMKGTVMIVVIQIQIHIRSHGHPLRHQPAVEETSSFATADSAST